MAEPVHVRWECKYQVVIIPKYRRKVWTEGWVRTTAPNGGYLTLTAPSGGLPKATAFGRGRLLRTKPTASGRATRRASSDPACIPSRNGISSFLLPHGRSWMTELMHEWQSQSHVRWECKYQVVIIPKYRRKVLDRGLRPDHSPQRGLPDVDGPLGGPS